MSVDTLFGTKFYFAQDTMECVGRPVGFMVANTWHNARRAANKVKVDYNCKILGPPILFGEGAAFSNLEMRYLDNLS